MEKKKKMKPVLSSGEGRDLKGNGEKIEESFNDKKTDENTRSVSFYLFIFGRDGRKPNSVVARK